MTLASIIIPSRGGALRLPRLLSALEAQDYPSWEAVVVVDGDIDGSEAVVARYAHLPVRSIVFPANLGRVAALNAGFAEARGDVLIRCDDDFEPSPGHVSAHVAPHLEHDCGVVGLPLNVAPPSPYMRAYGLNADRRGHDAAAATPTGLRWRLWGGNVSVTRRVYDSVGGYDARYQGYGWEDVDFGYRLHLLGIPIVIADGAETLHHMASITTAIRARRALASGSARWTFDTIHGVGASGAVRPTDSSTWNRLVSSMADRLTAERSDRLARAVDAVLPLLPTALGRKAVAAVVEASAVAGYQLGRQEKLTSADCRVRPRGLA